MVYRMKNNEGFGIALVTFSIPGYTHYSNLIFVLRRSLSFQLKFRILVYVHGVVYGSICAILGLKDEYISLYARLLNLYNNICHYLLKATVKLGFPINMRLAIKKA